MDTKWVRLAAVNGLIAVAAGAFGAHALKSRLAPESLTVFDVAVRYQMYHALALLGVAAVVYQRPSRSARAAGWCMLLGTVLFSGSLYGLTLGGDGFKLLGPITPIGGVLLIAGWLLLALSAGGRSYNNKASQA